MICLIHSWKNSCKSYSYCFGLSISQSIYLNSLISIWFFDNSCFLHFSIIIKLIKIIFFPFQHYQFFIKYYYEAKILIKIYWGRKWVNIFIHILLFIYLFIFFYSPYPPISVILPPFVQIVNYRQEKRKRL